MPKSASVVGLSAAHWALRRIIHHTTRTFSALLIDASSRSYCCEQDRSRRGQLSGAVVFIAKEVHMHSSLSWRGEFTGVDKLSKVSAASFLCQRVTAVLATELENFGAARQCVTARLGTAFCILAWDC